MRMWYAQDIGDLDSFSPGLLTGLGCVRLLEPHDLRAELDLELCFWESFALQFRDDLDIMICLETYTPKRTSDTVHTLMVIVASSGITM